MASHMYLYKSRVSINLSILPNPIHISNPFIPFILSLSRNLPSSKKFLTQFTEQTLDLAPAPTIRRVSLRSTNYTITVESPTRIPAFTRTMASITTLYHCKGAPNYLSRIENPMIMLRNCKFRRAPKAA